MTIIFLEKSHTKCVRESSTRSYFKKSNLSIALDRESEILNSMLLLYVQVENYQNILKLRRWPLGFTPNKAF